MEQLLRLHLAVGLSGKKGRGKVLMFSQHIISIS
jgi:hypothetical protein